MTEIIPAPPPGNVHTAVVEDREPRTRRKGFFFDRIKVLVLIAVFFLITVSYEQSQIPLMSWADAFRDQAEAKWWLWVVAGVEVVRQLHYFVSEHAGGYNTFWRKRVWEGWDRLMSRMKPYTRFRMARLAKRIAFVAVLGVILSWKWGLPFFQALAEAPSRWFTILFVERPVGTPLAISILLSVTFSAFYLIFFYGIFFLGGVETFKPGEIKTRFSDIWGQDHVVNRVQENLDFLEKPHEIESKGGYVPSGILLWGPPGTGKTLMAEATAGETERPYVFVDPQAFVQTFLGVAPMKMKWLYRKLRKLSLRYGGVVVFFDEADVLGSRGLTSGQFDGSEQSAREQLDHLHWLSPATQHLIVEQLRADHRARDIDVTSSPAPRRSLRERVMVMGGMGGGMGTLQALLTEMNGLNKPRGFWSRRIRQFLNIPAKRPPKFRILHIFATNLPSALDSALLRPGRIDRIYKVGYPMKDGRKKTFEGYFAKVSHTLTDDDIEKLAVMTPYSTGASIKDLVNEALLVALREDREIVTWNDVVRARYLRKVGEHEHVEFIERERHAIAIHEACHAVAAYLRRKDLVIDFVSIEPGGSYLGMVSSTFDDETFLRWRSTYEIDIMVSLASLAGERLFFAGDSSSGVSGDLRNATTVSAWMEGMWGMGTTLSSAPALNNSLAGGVPSATGINVDRENASLPGRIESRLGRIYDQARALLTEQRTMVLAIAHALETHKTISGEDVAAIMNGTVGPKVDGRPYHRAEFAAVAELYHAAALEAHRTVDDVEVELPVLPPIE
ncbi:MAG: AAA family ATPase [Acidimicrobiia bacterium]